MPSTTSPPRRSKATSCARIWCGVSRANTRCRTYVTEFLLGRYCASTDDAEIREGLEIVQRQLQERAVRAGEEELFKARAKNQGRVKLIGVVRARLDAKNDCFLVESPSLRLNDVRIDETLVHAHERMLTGGFYAEIDLNYDPTIAEERNGRPFGLDSLREIQLSRRDVLDTLAQGRALFSFEQWRDVLIRGIGLEPAALSPRTRDVRLLRMVLFVENNYNEKHRMCRPAPRCMPCRKWAVGKARKWSGAMPVVRGGG